MWLNHLYLNSMIYYNIHFFNTLLINNKNRIAKFKWVANKMIDFKKNLGRSKKLLSLLVGLCISQPLFLLFIWLVYVHQSLLGFFKCLQTSKLVSGMLVSMMIFCRCFCAMIIAKFSLDHDVITNFIWKIRISNFYFDDNNM